MDFDTFKKIANKKSRFNVTTVATINDLPSTNLAVGERAYVTSNNNFYVSNGAGWFLLTTVNSTPSVTEQTGGAVGGILELSADSIQPVLSFTANDADPQDSISWSFSLDSNASVMFASIANNSDGTFTALWDSSSVGQEEGDGIFTAIASDGKNQGTANLTIKQVVLGLGVTSVTGAAGCSAQQADGGIGYCWTSSGTITFDGDGTIEFVSVAGGGGGGSNYYSGGGGAGGYRHGCTSVLGGQTYCITIGAGGASNSPGGATCFFRGGVTCTEATVCGGEHGAGYTTNAPNNTFPCGGSGGGGGGASASGGSGGPFGNDGGNGTSPHGGGGGGAGGVGRVYQSACASGGPGGSIVSNGGAGCCTDLMGDCRPHAAGGGGFYFAGTYACYGCLSRASGIGGSSNTGYNCGYSQSVVNACPGTGSGGAGSDIRQSGYNGGGVGSGGAFIIKIGHI